MTFNFVIAFALLFILSIAVVCYLAKGFLVTQDIWKDYNNPLIKIASPVIIVFHPFAAFVFPKAKTAIESHHFFSEVFLLEKPSKHKNDHIFMPENNNLY